MDSLNASQFVSSNPKTPASLSRLYARPGFLLRRAHQISAAVFEDECRELALTPAQFGVLTVLQVAPGAGPVQPGAGAGLRQGDGAAGAARPGNARLRRPGARCG